MDSGSIIQRNFKFFHSMPQLISRDCVKCLFEVNKAIEYFFFVLLNLLNNVSQRDTMIHFRMIKPKTGLSSCPLFFYFCPLNASIFYHVVEKILTNRMDHNGPIVGMIINVSTFKKGYC